MTTALRCRVLNEGETLLIESPSGRFGIPMPENREICSLLYDLITGTVDAQGDAGSPPPEPNRASVTDSERLDWLEVRARELGIDIIGVSSDGSGDVTVSKVFTSMECETEALGVGPTLRDAIDAAMAEESGATA